MKVTIGEACTIVRYAMIASKRWKDHRASVDVTHRPDFSGEIWVTLYIYSRNQDGGIVFSTNIEEQTKEGWSMSVEDAIKFLMSTKEEDLHESK